MAVALADNALTDWLTAKDELGLKDNSLRNTVIRWINALSTAIESYCGRSFYYEAAKVEAVAGYGRRKLKLAKAPILSLDTITLDGVEVDTSDVTIHDANAGLLMRRSGWLWTTYEEQFVEARPIPGQERKAYEVTYECGYVTPNQSGTRTLPADLEYALLRWLAEARAWQGRDPRIKSEKLTTWAASYSGMTGAGASLSDPPPQVAQLLAPYRWDV